MKCPQNEPNPICLLMIHSWNNYNARPTAGGVAIYMSNNFSDCTVRVDQFSKVTRDFEILTVAKTKSDHRHFFAICVYKPPKGNLINCIDFLTEIVTCNDICNKGGKCILGDFNTDTLKLDDVNSVALQMFAKRSGLRQCINAKTRPHVRGGTCIDWIMSDCPVNHDVGVSDVLISDHYTGFFICKKSTEKKSYVEEVVRDYSKFNKGIFAI